MTNRKIEALQEAAAQKAKEAVERVDKALERMVKQGQVISFKSVSHAANVSTAYLYKQSELRERIENLRDQQKNRSKPKQPPPASDNSKSTIISHLREDNKRLRTEIEGLRRTNESLAGKLYQLQGASELAERFKNENELLKQQLESCRAMIQEVPSVEEPKVTSLENKRQQKAEITDSIKSELALLGIKLNSTLSKTIRATSPSVVEDAIAAYKQALELGEVINSPGGWLKSAIENGWTKNNPQQQSTNFQPSIHTASESESSEELLDSSKIDSLFKGLKNE